MQKHSRINITSYRLGDSSSAPLPAVACHTTTVHVVPVGKVQGLPQCNLLHSCHHKYFVYTVQHIQTAPNINPTVSHGNTDTPSVTNSLSTCTVGNTSPHTAVGWANNVKGRRSAFLYHVSGFCQRPLNVQLLEATHMLIHTLG